MKDVSEHSISEKHNTLVRLSVWIHEHGFGQIRKEALRIILKTAMLSSLLVFFKSLVIRRLIQDMFPEYQWTYILRQNLPVITGSVLSVIPPIVFLVALLEVILRLLPSKFIGEKWRTSSWIPSVSQSFAFGFLIVSFDYYMRFYPENVIIVSIVCLFSEMIVRSGTSYEHEVVRSQEPQAREDSLEFLDRIVLLVLLSLSLVVVLSLLMVVLSHFFSVNIAESVYWKSALFLVMGNALAEVVASRISSQSKVTPARLALIPSIAFIALGLVWGGIPFYAGEFGIWFILGVLLWSLYPHAREKLLLRTADVSQWIIHIKSNTELENDQIFLRRIILLFILHLSVFAVYTLIGARFSLSPESSLSVQVLWNGFDPCIVFATGSDYYGVSTLGFLLPLILMSYILLVKTKDWHLRFDFDVLLAFLGTLIISLFFNEVRSTGVGMTFVGSILCVMLAVGLGLGSNWNRKEAKAIQIWAAVWFGLIPADFLYGLGILSTGFFPNIVCIGGFGWGIGDGLWAMSLYMMFLMLLFSVAKNDVEEEDDDTETEVNGADSIIFSFGKKRMVKALLFSLVIILAWIIQLFVTICGILWYDLNENLYPLGVFQEPTLLFPSIGVLAENMLLVLLASICLELLDTLITRRLNQTTSFSLPLKTISVTILSLSHLMIRGGGLITFHPFSLFLITAALIAYVDLRVEHFFEEDISEDIEFERALSPRVTATLSVLLFVFYTRSFPFVILTRFESALLMLSISLVFVCLTIGIGFHFARELTNSISVYLTEKQSEYLQLGIVMIFALEISWALTPIPPLVPVVILFSWGLHKVLSNRCPKRFGREVITVGKRGSIRGMIPNLKAICLCVMLIIGPTLVYNKILGVTSPSVILSDTRIAIIDDGINTQTNILREHVVAARSFVDTSLGYTETNPDPLPETFLTSHATHIALAILDIYPGASLINARVRDSDNDFTKIGFEEAVRWCVTEENATIISLSFGSYKYDLEDGRYDEILDWAWNRGVLIVASAGNDNQASWTQGGLSNVVYPGANLKVMAVGASNSSGQVHPNSSRGPVHTGVLKPDILAPGYLYDNDLKWGTSFAAPRAAAAAAMIIDALNEAQIHWTPGLIRAAMVSSATDTDAPSYAQGGGLVDVEETLSTIINAPRNQDDLPLVISTLPSSLPLDFEILFAGVNHSARISVFCSTLLNISLEIPSSLQGVVAGGGTRINQCGYIDLYLTPTNSSIETFYEGVVTIASEMVSTSIDVSINARVPKARLAIDTSHDRRNWYTTYMLFLQYTKILNQNDIAVTEIRNPEDFCESKLAMYDGLVILNPYSSWYGEERKFSEQDRVVIEQYVANGGSLLLAVSGTSNRTATNLLLNWTGISLQEGTSWSSDVNITDHPIVEGVSYPDDSYYEERPSFSTFNTTSEYTWVMSFPGFFIFPPEAIIVCGEIPSRVAAIGRSEWFQNNQLLDVDSAEAMLVINLTNWVLGFI